VLYRRYVTAPSRLVWRLAEESSALIGPDEIETVRVKLESILGSATAKRKLLAALDEVSSSHDRAVSIDASSSDRRCRATQRYVAMSPCRRVERIGLHQNDQPVRRE
jgi:hypothetical protein